MSLAVLKSTVDSKSLQDGLKVVTASQQVIEQQVQNGSPADLEVWQVVQLSDAVPGQI